MDDGVESILLSENIIHDSKKIEYMKGLIIAVNTKKGVFFATDEKIHFLPGTSFLQYLDLLTPEFQEVLDNLLNTLDFETNFILCSFVDGSSYIQSFTW